MKDVEAYFLLFVIYSILGWVIEVVFKLFQYHRFVNRGFLIGPYCPIYGYGAIIMTFILQKYRADLLVLFCMSMLICSVLEYITSYVMEKCFSARWWDYSGHKFHVNGRVCLKNAILFGIGGCIVIRALNPVIWKIIKLLSSSVSLSLALILFMIYIIDNIISFKIMAGFKKYTNIGFKDHTEEANQFVISETKEMTKRLQKEFSLWTRKMKDNKQLFDQKTEWLTMKIKEIYKNKSYLSRRLIEAFPNFKAILSEKLERKDKYAITKSERGKNQK